MNEENNINVNTEVQDGVEQAPQADEKMLPQSKVNEIVESRLKREREKLEKQFNERFNALEEAQKLSQMNDEQKQEYDYSKKLEELTKREEELEAKINAYNQQQYKATIQSQLAEAGLPTNMADMLVNLDAEAVASQISAMKEMFNAQLNAQIESRVQASASVPTQATEQVKLLSLDEIKSMSPSEYMANKELVEKSLQALKK